MNYLRSGAAWLNGLSPVTKVAIGAGTLGAYAVSSYMSQSFENFRCKGNGRVVVISGCDSGFGEALARLLNDHGFCVYALCYTENGVRDLRTKLSTQSQVIRFDITKQECIDALRDRLRSDGVQIWALVNNAGVFESTIIEAAPLDAFRRSMEVNCFGHVAVTKALLPMIPRGGRILNMASVAGRICTPGFSCYAMSKHALEAFNDSLRIEMRSFGIHVSCFEPFYMKTPMLSELQGRVQKRMWERAPSEVKERYGQEYIDKHIALVSDSVIEDISAQPQAVVDAYFHAIGSQMPWTHYKVNVKGPIVIALKTLLPTKTFDALVSRNWTFHPKAATSR